MKRCECGGEIPIKVGRGRPRIRCLDCSPEQLAAPGTYIQPRMDRLAKCPACRQPFTTSYPLTKYCSSRCRNVASNRKATYAARDRSVRPCRFCLIPFAPVYGESRRVFCSAACGHAQRSLDRSGPAHVRRALRFGVPSELVHPEVVFARDGWNCRICGEPTPKALRGSKQPKAPELDHVVALSKGGPHTYANVQCACRSCNQRKGSRIIVVQATAAQHSGGGAG